MHIHVYVFTSVVRMQTECLFLDIQSVCVSRSALAAHLRIAVCSKHCHPELFHIGVPGHHRPLACRVTREMTKAEGT